MKRKRIELSLLLITILLFPVAAFAQDDMTFGEEEVDSGAGANVGGDAAAGAGDDMSFDEGDVSTGEDAPMDMGGDAVGDAAAGDVGAAGDGLLDLNDLSLDGGADVGVGKPTTKEGEKVSDGNLTVLERHPIWAIQQVYALRKGRFDFQPSLGVSLNDPFVQHQSVNLGLSYYITEVLSVGVSFNWYRFLNKETDVNYSIKRATHQTVPINEYFWGGQLNMTYVPMYGKFALLNNWILHWDVWFVGGGGFIFTKPYSVIDVDYRTFEWEIKIAFNVGIGGRMYLTRFLAVFVELRDYIFPEKLEELKTLPDPARRADESNWISDEVKLTNNVMLQAGISVFLPPSFDFKLPK
ncbi:MAG: outer membrane beta-barrel domain-containing protein [Deltaproteobacteria bacterium]|nr:outer membrane beta-barrel domain-containing protein [Deltaproteobacteria bacterium]